MSILIAVVIGFAGGVVGGLFGVGGGVLFVPALVLAFDLTQIEAIASSLVAIIPVAVVGTARQHRYGNVNFREGLLVGLFSIPAVVGATALANALGNRVLELGFALLLIFMATRLISKSLK